jgi:hypothetical protein
MVEIVEERIAFAPPDRQNGFPSIKGSEQFRHLWFGKRTGSAASSFMPG